VLPGSPASRTKEKEEKEVIVRSLSLHFELHEKR
jgi:hypothetical protein